MHKEANRSIECSVVSCAYHCQDKNYCSLDTIKVSNTGATATNAEATECASFDVGSAQ